jgi:phosphate transport system substrate-binding protein
MPNYKCTNFGQCPKADKGELIDVAPGAEAFCPECEKELKRAQAASAPMPGWLKLAIPVVLLLLAGGAYFLLREPEKAVVVTPPPAENVVKLNGSDTVAKAASLLAAGYSKAKVEVQGRGSATGFTCLADRSCDIGMSSRKITPAEAESLKSLGDMTSNQAELVVALDLVVAAVSPADPLASVDEARVKSILCGVPSSHNVHLRGPGSGTLDLVRSRYACAVASSSESNAALDSKIAADPKGFGLLSRTAVAQSKALPIGATTDLRQATEADPWVRRLYFYLPPNASAAAKEFADYARSSAAQAILEKAGFVGQTPEVVPPPVLPMTPPPPPEYAGLSTGADRVSIDLRFRLNSSELDSKAIDDLGRIVEILKNPKYGGRHIVLIGFADSQGGEAGNLKLSRDRAATVSAELQKRGITPAVVTGFGAAMPVAGNDTEEGRQKNRRVEVWLRR